VDVELSTTSTGSGNIGKHHSTEDGFLSVAVGSSNSPELRADNKRAKAPESPSPRVSLTVNEPTNASRGSTTSSRGSTASAGVDRGSTHETLTREAKIKAQLDALPEHHRNPPAPWGIYYTDDGDLYFWNQESDESMWEYPIPDNK